jgi:erythrin-vacuolar iron transport family protein
VPASPSKSYSRKSSLGSLSYYPEILGDLEEVERQHYAAESLEQRAFTPAVREEEETTRRRLFVLQIVQPGLAGLMDGSISTLAPLFAAAFATRSSSAAFLVGLAASVGAGISMGFAEALSDDGSLTGRVHPWLRGLVEV